VQSELLHHMALSERFISEQRRIMSELCCKKLKQVTSDDVPDEDEEQEEDEAKPEESESEQEQEDNKNQLLSDPRDIPWVLNHLT
jgi:hypothetical protein